MKVLAIKNLQDIIVKPYPIRTIEHGSKHATCPVCGRKWDVGRRGGGMIVGASIKHIRACATKELSLIKEAQL